MIQLGSEPETSQRLAVDELEGLEIATRMDRQAGRLIYELKIPLHLGEGTPFALGVQNGGPIGIGLV